MKCSCANWQYNWLNHDTSFRFHENERTNLDNGRIKETLWNLEALDTEIFVVTIGKLVDLSGNLTDFFLVVRTVRHLPNIVVVLPVRYR